MRGPVIAAALKHALGGYHVLVRRNARQQWLSCRSYREKVSLPYFELCHFLILALAPAGTPARRFAVSAARLNTARASVHASWPMWV